MRPGWEELFEALFFCAAPISVPVETAAGGGAGAGLGAGLRRAITTQRSAQRRAGELRTAPGGTRRGAQLRPRVPAAPRLGARSLFWGGRLYRVTARC